ncbi:MAG TPA: hypothetical protein VGC14_02485 [Rhizobium sp.]
MNHSAATSEARLGGYIGKFRPVWAATFRNVEDRDGNVLYFKTAFEAECVAWRILYALEQPIMLRSGDRVESAKQDAEAIFDLPPIRTKGRVITIERKRIEA